MISSLEFFDLYTKKLGWKVIPIQPRSKKPYFRNWNTNYNLDFCRETILRSPNSNLGLLLGDLIDVEGDDYESNEILWDLTKDYPHPIYVSEKSLHHLFLNNNKIKRISIKNIEFRGILHQSLLPPSVNSNGIKYSWHKDSQFPVPPIPEKLLSFYKKYKEEKNDLLLKNCSMCRSKQLIHYRRYKKEIKAFRCFHKEWQCKKCRSEHIKKICKYI